MKIFKQQQFVQASPVAVYNVISNINNYHKFIPFCSSSNILKTKADLMLDAPLHRQILLDAELGISFYKFKESYISQVTCIPFNYVKATSQSKLFKDLTTIWKINGNYTDNECKVEYTLKYEFNMLLYEKLSRLVFDSMSSKMMDAFIQEIKRQSQNETQLLI
eukprot:NODE_108_length_18904_cov_0.654826.p14 type:complete len:163 gc:universal NODE_108_length_18904_cov_0.654826:13205-13693(+)